MKSGEAETTTLTTSPLALPPSLAPCSYQPWRLCVQFPKKDSVLHSTFGNNKDDDFCKAIVYTCVPMFLSNWFYLSSYCTSLLPLWRPGDKRENCNSGKDLFCLCAAQLLMELLGSEKEKHCYCLSVLRGVIVIQAMNTSARCMNVHGYYEHKRTVQSTAL